jgi:hypothetical protein
LTNCLFFQAIKKVLPCMAKPIILIKISLAV